MAKTKRVFQIAKELGVTSKDIVAKCQAEDIPDVNNHMSTVSLGLAATISEWFSDSESGGGGTAVQVAAPVDVIKARAKAKKKATKKTKTKTIEEEKITVAVETEPVTKATKVKAEKTAPVKKQTTKKAAVKKVITISPQTVEEAPTTIKEVEPRKETEAPLVAAEAPTTTTPLLEEETPKVVMNVPERPKDIGPVGPMLQAPTKTTLAGPKLIRVEAPEVIPAPKPKSDRKGGTPMARGGPRSGRGASSMPPMSPEEQMMVGGRSAGAGKPSRRNKRRTTGTENKRTAKGGQSGQQSQSSNWREQDLLEREQRLNRSGGFFRTHRRDSSKRGSSGAKRTPTLAQTGGKISVAEPVSIKELSAATGVKAAQLIKQLFLDGTVVTINSILDSDKSIEVMLEFGIELDVIEQKSAEQKIQASFAERKMTDERLRPPVVTILGHVDHGKTSLLDSIRNTKVAEGEAGGITQATSAFCVPVKAGDTERMIVFLDTPGHEAFTEMRARGAKVTDVVVLVIAADDGVMPQTIESINHAKAAGVPVIVALNKIDKPEATDDNIQRIFGQLAEHDLNPTDWGGDTEVVRMSAINGEGIQDLLEHLDYQAQLHEWKADYGGAAEGSVIEAQLEEGRGPVARLLVQQGQLNKGDFIVIGRTFGRVRDIINEKGQRIATAGPSIPVAISGIDLVPDAGDKFYVVNSLKKAEAAAEERRTQERVRDLATPKITLDNIFAKLEEGSNKELNLIVKADVQGSVETLNATLSKLEIEDVTITVLHSAVGGVNESDITLAEASGAVIIGFNVTSSSKARTLADQKKVDIRLYDVIYDITDDVEKAAKGLLDPIHRLEVLGHADVRQVFKISKIGMIAGCYVTDGTIERNAQIRVTRGGIVVESDRKLEQLKRFKDDAKEVRAGQECGMKIDGYDDIKEGDVLECYKTIEVART